MLTNASEFAVFPLPRIVAFPGHTLQFHIFEPRYRKMVQDCIERDLPLGIAQGDPLKRSKQQISAEAAFRTSQTSAGRDSNGNALEEFLRSNQESYSPKSVFGAGPVKILQVLPDGRSIIEVKIKWRVQTQMALQHVPYLRVEGCVQADEPSDAVQARVLFDNLIALSFELLGRKVLLFEDLLPHTVLAQKDLAALVYRILQWCVVEPDEGQLILEMNDPCARAHVLLKSMRLFLSNSSAVGQNSPEPKNALGDQNHQHEAPVIAINAKAQRVGAEPL